VQLTFTRDRAFYFTTVFIPGIILVTSSFITFWLEWNAVPARVMIGKHNHSKGMLESKKTYSAATMLSVKFIFSKKQFCCQFSLATNKLN
jgi:hypothetical protein